MKSIVLSPIIQKYIDLLFKQDPRILRIVSAIAQKGGRALLVGGVVRDLIMGKPNKDIDIEVQGLSLESLEEVLRSIGPVSLVGKSFGVLRLHDMDFDWSVPRTDSSGRKPVVTIDPHLSVEDAFRRRDLTINAMGIDLHTQELIDPFNGLKDIEEKRLRAPDIKLFIEDPLRFYRVMQFTARLSFVPDEDLNAVCTTMDVSGVSRERIETEFEKMLLKSERPSLGLRWLQKIGRLKELFPELGATIGAPHRVEFHPEGDVFEHSMQALDAAVPLAQKLPDTHQKLILLYAALCHDLGKPLVTQMIDGIWRSSGHDVAGVEPTKSFLKRITHNQDLIHAVVLLVRYHMQPGQFIGGGAKPPAYKRLANHVAPYTTLYMLSLVSLADKRGRNPESHEPLKASSSDNDIHEFLKRAEAIKVSMKPEEPILQGRDLLEEIAPGPQLGKLLHKAYEIQIEEGVTDKEELKKRVLKKASD